MTRSALQPDRSSDAAVPSARKAACLKRSSWYRNGAAGFESLGRPGRGINGGRHKHRRSPGGHPGDLSALAARSWNRAAGTCGANNGKNRGAATIGTAAAAAATVENGAARQARLAHGAARPRASQPAPVPGLGLASGSLLDGRPAAPGRGALVGRLHGTSSAADVLRRHVVAASARHARPLARGMAAKLEGAALDCSCPGVGAVLKGIETTKGLFFLKHAGPQGTGGLASDRFKASRAGGSRARTELPHAERQPAARKNEAKQDVLPCSVLEMTVNVMIKSSARSSGR